MISHCEALDLSGVRSGRTFLAVSADRATRPDRRPGPKAGEIPDMAIGSQRANLNHV
jgi:hypothetical protein